MTNLVTALPASSGISEHWLILATALVYAVTHLSIVLGRTFLAVKDPSKFKLPDDTKPGGLLAITVGFGLLGLSSWVTGCASNHTLLTREVTDTNGVVTVTRADNRSFALWPGKADVDKQRISNTPHGQAIGIEGVSADGGGTNLVEFMHSVERIADKFKP